MLLIFSYESIVLFAKRRGEEEIEILLSVEPWRVKESEQLNRLLNSIRFA